MSDLIIPSTKPRVFSFGACDLTQAIVIDTIRRDFSVDAFNDPNDNLDLSVSRPIYSTSIRSLYTPPNAIANRVYDTIKNSTDVKRHHYDLYREIAKISFLDYFKKEAGPNDILVMNLSSELYTKINVKSELFTVIPHIGKGIQDPLDCLHWIYAEYLTNEIYQIPFDEEESLNITYDLLQDFAKDIYDIFQDRVILVKTHITNLMIATDSEIKKVKVPIVGNIPFYKSTKIISHPLDHTYAQRATNLLLKKFQKWYKADVPIVELTEPIFMDPYHKYGVAPFHLHSSSNYKIGLKIHQALKKLKDGN